MTTDPLSGNTIAKMQQFDGRACRCNLIFWRETYEVNNLELKKSLTGQRVAQEDKALMIGIVTALK